MFVLVCKGDFIIYIVHMYLLSFSKITTWEGIFGEASVVALGPSCSLMEAINILYDG